MGLRHTDTHWRGRNGPIFLTLDKRVTWSSIMTPKTSNSFSRNKRRGGDVNVVMNGKVGQEDQELGLTEVEVALGHP